MLSAAPAAAPIAPVASVAQVAAPAPVAPCAVAPVHKRSNLSINDGSVTMNGETKKWKDLTPAEKAEVRKSLAEARAEISRINRDEIQRDVREAMNEARISKEEFRREMAEARVEIDRAMREIDAHAVELRRAGQSPEQIKATVRASLKSVEAIDIEAITRNAHGLGQRSDRWSGLWKLPRTGSTRRRTSSTASTTLKTKPPTKYRPLPR